MAEGAQPVAGKVAVVQRQVVLELAVDVSGEDRVEHVAVPVSIGGKVVGLVQTAIHRAGGIGGAAWRTGAGGLDAHLGGGNEAIGSDEQGCVEAYLCLGRRRRQPAGRAVEGSAR